MMMSSDQLTVSTYSSLTYDNNDNYDEEWTHFWLAVGPHGSMTYKIVEPFKLSRLIIDRLFPKNLDFSVK